MPENRQGQSNGTVLAVAGACGGTRHSAGTGRPVRGRAGMGLTIVHKSDLTTRKKNPRVALVLAGGAVTGGAYKLGGLKALDDFLVNRKTTDFDIYVGLSAGAFLAAPLAGGVTPPEMLRSLDGTSEDFTYLSPLDFYNPNLAEFAQKPLEFLVDLLTYVPSALYDFLAQTPELVRSLQEPSFQGDIILLEPGETDLAFFKMAPLNLWAGRNAGAHGYLSVTQAIEAHYEMIRQILQTYGVLMTRKEVREGLERLLRNEPSEGPEDLLLRDVPKRELRVA